MKKNFLYIFFILLLFANHNESFAQRLVADISGTQTTYNGSNSISGCEGVAIQFSIDPEGGTVTNYSWNLGNGNSSTLASPFDQYNATGIFTVTANFDYNGTPTTITATNFIEVFDVPNVSLEADVTSGCVGTTVQLVVDDTTYLFDEVTYLIDNQTFQGDTSLAGAPVSVTLNNSGVYDVDMRVITQDGCDFIVSRTGYITILDDFDVSMSISQELFCGNTVTVDFIGEARNENGMLISNDSVTYTWDFGDGNTASGDTVSHTYNIADGLSFTPSVVGRIQNCEGSTTNSLALNHYTITDGFDFTLPSTNCNSYEITFDPLLDETTFAGYQILWDFGDGDSLVANIGDNVVHDFSNSTLGTITRTVSISVLGVDDNSCIYSENVTIPPVPTAEIEIVTNDLNFCSNPYLVNVEIVNTTNLNNFFWRIQGETTEQFHNQDSVQLTLSNSGMSTIQIVFDSGDPATNCVLDEIDVETADLDVSISGDDEGCEPFGGTLNATVGWNGGALPTGISIASYEWQIVDLNTSTVIYSDTTTVDNLNFAGLAWGEYEAFVTVISDSVGMNAPCQVTSSAFPINVGVEPTLSFTAYPEPNICNNSMVTFTNTSTVPAGYTMPVTYEWSVLNDGNYVASTDPNGNFTTIYNGLADGTTIDVALRSYTNGCYSTALVEVGILTIVGPNPIMSFTTDACNPTSIEVDNISTGMPSNGMYMWDFTFNDGGSISTYSTTTSNLTEDPTENGDFPIFGSLPQGDIPASTVIDVDLTIIDTTSVPTVTPPPFCEVTQSFQATMPPAIPTLSVSVSDDSVCVGEGVIYTPSVTNAVSYTWSIQGDQATPVTITDFFSTPTINFTVPGNYTGTLDMILANGCSYTITLPSVRVDGVSFDLDVPTAACVGADVDFDLTNFVTSSSSINWYWIVDTDTVQTGTGTPISSVDNYVFNSSKMPQSDTYDVTLAVDNGICTYSRTEQIIITKPNVEFTGNDADYVTFEYGCDDITTEIDISLSMDDLYNPFTATFDWYMYDTGTGTSTPVAAAVGNNFAPFEFVLSDGMYDFILVVTDENGCSDQDTVSFTVPAIQVTEPDFTVDNNVLMCPDFVNFTDLANDLTGNTLRREVPDGFGGLKSIDPYLWEWDFGDGIFVNSGNGSVAHYYARPGTYQARLRVRDQLDDGTICISDWSNFLTITVGGTQGSFEFDRYIGYEFYDVNTLDSLAVNLTAFPIDDPNTDITQTQYVWASGDGQLGTDSVQTFKYIVPAGNNQVVYTPSLTFRDENGCDYPADYSGSLTVLDCPEFTVSDVTRCTSEGQFSLDITDTNFSTVNIDSADYTYNSTLHYQWSVNGTAVSSADGGDLPTVTINFGDAATAATNPWIVDPDDTPKVYSVRVWIEADYTDKNDATNNITGEVVCEQVQSFNVDYDPNPVAFFQVTNAITNRCEGTVLNLDASGTNFAPFTGTSIATYEWDLDNDGAYDDATGVSVNNNFGAAGFYMVGLRVTSDEGCQHIFQDQLVVTPIPVADFTYQNVCGSYGIQFTDLSSVTDIDSDEIDTWEWDFDNDGTYDTTYTTFASTITYDYQAAGKSLDQQYNVSLRVTTNKNCTHTYSLTNIPVYFFNLPVMDFVAERQADNLPLEACVGEDFLITNNTTIDNSNLSSFIPPLTASTNEIVRFEWDFGDGNTSVVTNRNPFTHQYTAAGTYTISLTAVTERNCATILQKDVEVHEFPNLAIESNFTEGSDFRKIICEGSGTISPRAGSALNANFDYLWTIQQVNGGAANVSVGNTFNTHSFDVNAVSYDSGSRFLEVGFDLVVIDTSENSNCTITLSDSVYIYRDPDILFADSIGVSDCDTSYTIMPLGTEVVNGYTYQWSNVPGSMSGGVVTSGSSNNQDYYTEVTSFDPDSAHAQMRYALRVRNDGSFKGINTGCDDRDSVTVHFFRTPEITNQDSLFCALVNDTLQFTPFDTENIVDFTNVWSETTAPTGGAVDYLDLNVQNLEIEPTAFDNSSTKITGSLTLLSTNSLSPTCTDSETYDYTIYRKPDINLTEMKAGGSCSLEAELKPFGNEAIDYDYTWSLVSAVGGTVSVQNNLTDQDLTIQVDNFDSLSSIVQVRCKLVAVHKESMTCADSSEITVEFYRTPITDLNHISRSPLCEDGSIDVSPSEATVNGFVYEWTVTDIFSSPTDGAGETISISDTSIYEPTISNPTFLANSSLTTVQLNLKVSNLANPTCFTQDTLSLTFYVNPDPALNVVTTEDTLRVGTGQKVYRLVNDQATVQFEDQSTHQAPGININAINWDFGDGNNLFAQTPLATVTSNYINQYGETVISLTAIDDRACQDSVQTRIYLAPEPIIDPVQITNVCIGDSTQFSVLVDYAIDSLENRTDNQFDWDFGDGTGWQMNLGESPTHYYATPDNLNDTTFTATLRVTSRYGTTSTRTFDVDLLRTPYFDDYEIVYNGDSCSNDFTAFPLGQSDINTGVFNYSWVATNVTGTDGNTPLDALVADPTNEDQNANVGFALPSNIFGQNETRVVLTYELTMANVQDSLNCIAVLDTSMTFYRTPVYLNDSITRANFCDLEVDIKPLGDSITIAHGAGFNYQWSIVDGSLTGASISEADFLIQSGLATQLNNQNVNLSISNTIFANGESEIFLQVRSEIENTFRTSCQDSKIYDVYFYRTPEIDFTDDLTACGDEINIAPLGAELVNGFSYLWQITSFDGFDGTPSITAGNDTLQNLNFSISNSDFISDTSVIDLDFRLSVAHPVDVSDSSCLVTKDTLVKFYRTPIVDLTYQKVANDTCAQIATLFPLEDTVKGFIYEWSLVSENRGHITLPSDLSARELLIEVDSFAMGEVDIEATFKLKVWNSESVSCVDSSTVDIRFYRTPETMVMTTGSTCDQDVMFTSANETLMNADYVWNQLALSGGTVNIMGDSTRELQVMVDDYSDGSTQIDVTYEVAIINTLVANDCDDYDTLSYTFYRPPLIDLTIERDSCDGQIVFKSFGDETIAGFDYQWSIDSLRGGSVQNSDLSLQNLSVSPNLYDSLSHSIEVFLSLEVENIASGCTNIQDTSVVLKRIPNAFTSADNQNTCASDTLSFSADESDNSGFVYDWSRIQLEDNLNQPKTTIYESNRNSYELDLSYDNNLFSGEELFVEGLYEINIQNSLSDSCVSVDTVNARFYRIPETGLSFAWDNSDSCAQELTITPMENKVSGFIYSWSIVEVDSGSVDTLWINDDYELEVSVDSYNTGESIIEASIEVEITNSLSGSCTVKDTIDIVFYRPPFIVATVDSLACTSEFTLHSTPEEVSGFNYTWSQTSVNGGSVSMGVTDKDSLVVNVTSFDSASTFVDVVYQLDVMHDSVNACPITENYAVRFYRTPQLFYNIAQDSCSDTAALNPISNEVISGYNFTWSKTNTIGGQVSTADSTSQILNLNLSNFDSLSHKVTVDYHLDIENPDQNSCSIAHDTTVVFYRTPSVVFATDSLFSCADSSLVASVQEDSIGGFDYTWRQISIQSDQSVVSQQINQNSLSDYELQTTFANVDFPSDAARMIFGYELSVENAESTSCANLDTINFVYYRIPDFDLTVTRAGNDSCASMATFQADEAQVNGFNYQWTVLDTTGGAVSVVNNLTDYNLDVALDSFAIGSSEVEVEVELIVGNSFTTNCTQRDTLSVIFYRTPDLVLNLDQSACSEHFVLNITEESVGGFNYEWDVINVLGGSVSYTNYLDDSLAVSVDSFANGSSFIDVSVELDVENANSTSCQDTTSTMVRIHRTPVANIQLDLLDCAQSSQVDAIGGETVSGYTYLWTLIDDEGGSVQITNPTGEVTDIRVQSFDSLSFDIDVSVALSITNTDNPSCIDLDTLTFKFYRTPDASISADSLFACSDGQIQVSPTELANDSLIYIWSVGTVVSDQGDNLAIQHNGLNSYQFSSSFVNATFSGQATVAYAKVGLDVQNTSLTSCLDTDSAVLTYYRIPKVEAKATPMVSCTEGVEFTLDEDSIGNFNYYWKQESVTGGTVTALGDSSDWNFEVLASSFDSGSHQIELTYSVLVVNNNSTTCSETDTITYIIERAPHIDLFVSAHNCEDDISLNAINAEGITGFEYTWTKLTETGGAVTNTDTTSANLNVMLDRFDNTAHKLEADYEVRVSNPDLALCDEVSDTTVVFYRIPEAEIANSTYSNCADNVISLSAVEDSVGGFNYRWEEIAMNTDAGSLTALSSVSDTSNYELSLNMTNVDFPVTTSTVSVTYVLHIENSESGSCTDSDTVSVNFYRTPNADLAFTRTANDSCSNSLLLAPTEAQVTGFNYKWRTLSVNGGTISLDTLLSGYELEVTSSSFDNGSAQITAQFEILVQNSADTLCADRDTISVNLYRTPEVVYSKIGDDCDDEIDLFANSESISDFNYTWTLQTSTGGTYQTSALTSDSLNIETLTFDNGSSQIDLTYNLRVENALSTNCWVDTLVSESIFRIPEIDFALNLDSCDLLAEIDAIQSENISGYTYQWRVLNSVGGSVAINDSTLEDIDLSVTNFDSLSHKIITNLEVQVRNANQMTCADLDTIEVIFHRSPSAQILAVQRDTCAGNELALRPIESENSGFIYQWSRSDVRVDTGTAPAVSMQAATNAYNQSFIIQNSDFTGQTTTAAFAAFLNVENTESSNCSSTDSVILTFYRIPEVDLVSSYVGNDSCSDQINIRPQEIEISNFEYSWSKIEEEGGSVSEFTNLDVYQLGVDVNTFNVGSSVVRARYELMVRNESDLTCSARDTIDVFFYRTPDILAQSDLQTCEQAVVLTSNTENVVGFEYQWNLESISGGSLQLGNTSYDSLEVSSPSFDNGNHFIDARFKVVSENEVTACQDSSEVDIRIHRVPSINFDITKADCDENAVITSFGSELIAGFDYEWDILDDDGGQVSIDNSAAQDVRFIVNYYDSLNAKIDLDFRLTVENNDSPDCEDIQDSTLTFYRTPKATLAFDSLTSCMNMLSISAVEDSIPDFNYAWSIQSLNSDGENSSISIENSDLNQYNLDILVDSAGFPASASWVSMDVMLNVENSFSSTCSDLDSAQLIFYRQPKVELASAYIGGDSCSSHISIFPQEDSVGGFTYTWRNISTTGGNIVTDHLNTAHTLEVEAISFNGNETEIHAQFELVVQNSSSTTCSASDVIDIYFYKTPTLSFSQNNQYCSSDNILVSPVEDENENYNYTWDVVSLTDQNGNTYSFDQVSDLNDYQLGLVFNSFPQEVSELDAVLVLSVENSLNTQCQVFDTLQFSILRSPEVNLMVEYTPSCLDETMRITPDIDFVEDYNYTWELDTAYDDLGNSIIPVTSDLQGKYLEVSRPSTIDMSAVSFTAVYRVSIENTSTNTCISSDTISLRFDRAADISLAVADTLSCSDEVLSLRVNESRVDRYSFDWYVEQVLSNTSEVGTVDHTLDSQDRTIQLDKPSFPYGSSYLNIDLRAESHNLENDSCSIGAYYSAIMIRKPSFENLSETIADCGLQTLIKPFGDESIAGYENSWSIQSSSGLSINPTLDSTQVNMMDLSFGITEADFSTGSHKAEITFALTTANNSIDSLSCVDSVQYTSVFYRTPSIAFEPEYLSSDSCSNQISINSSSEDISGFNYTWVKVEEEGGSVSVSNDMTKEVEITVDNFEASSSVIEVLMRLDVENSESTSCTTSDTIRVRLFRDPSAQIVIASAADCNDQITFTPQSDMIEGIAYNWTENEIVGGQINTTGQGTSFEADIISFDSASHKIDFEVTLTTQNTNSNSCSNTETVSYTFYRTPEINFAVVEGDCEETKIINPFGSEVMMGYDYSWSISSQSGGTIQLSSTSSESISVNVNQFNSNSHVIDAIIRLEVQNSESTTCSDIEEISIQFNRTPSVTLNSDERIVCEDDQITLGLDEDVLNGFDYQWVQVNLSTDTAGVTSLNNTDLSLPSIDLSNPVFPMGAAIVTSTYELQVLNENSTSCLASDTITVSFARTPTVELIEVENNFCSVAAVPIFPIEDEDVRGYTYQWRKVVARTDQGDDVTLLEEGLNEKQLFVSFDDELSSNISEITATYELLVFNSYLPSCQASEQITFTIQRAGAVSIIEDEDSICGQTSYSFTPGENMPENYSFEWTKVEESTDLNTETNWVSKTSLANNAIQIDIDSFPTGTAQITASYSLMVSRNGNAMCVTDSVYTRTFIREPNAFINNEYQICYSDSITLVPLGMEEVSNFSYRWTQIQGFEDNDGLEHIISYSDTLSETSNILLTSPEFPDNVYTLTTRYQLEIWNNFSPNCKQTLETDVVFYRLPEFVVADTTSICEGEGITLSMIDNTLSGFIANWDIVDVKGGSINSISNLSRNQISVSENAFSSESDSIKISLIASISHQENTSCIEQKEVEVYIIKTPEVVLSITDNCEDTAVLFDASESLLYDKPHRFYWSIDLGNVWNETTEPYFESTFNQAGDQEVWLRIENETGCSSDIFKQQFYVNPTPEPLFSIENTCLGVESRLVNSSTISNNTPLTYSWEVRKDSMLVYTTDESEPVLNLEEAGNYEVVLYAISELGCRDSLTKNYEVYPLPVVQISEDKYICEGDAINLNVSGGEVYHWSTEEEGEEIVVSPTEDTYYYVEVTDENGCISTDSVKVSVIPRVPLESKIRSCVGEVVTLDARIMNYDGLVQTYEWSTGATTPYIDVTESGIYTVQSMVEHASGVSCMNTLDINVKFNQAPPKTLEADTVYCFEFGDVMTLSAAEGDDFTYYWHDTGETTRTVERRGSGTYSVTVVDESDTTFCTMTDTISVQEICPPRVYLPNAFTPNNDGLNDVFILKTAYALNITLKIFNRWGEEIFFMNYENSEEANEEGNAWDGKNGSKEMPAGTYNYIIMYESELERGKMLTEYGQITLIR
ncbi:PKD domain-containing protein [Sediminitomix flava]|uniref:Gliding motility-associated-like protein n=1 Tax=Sediminitomix flava TaxID=379075 RepID=A0A315Z6R9_SEDFL|nr:PKD domain-containing protein [Sediminitomix flava]PWJ40087.1 gliding motility-associated-like protein [Sediminitomix flava]